MTSPLDPITINNRQFTVLDSNVHRDDLCPDEVVVPHNTKACLYILFTLERGSNAVRLRSSFM